LPLARAHALAISTPGGCPRASDNRPTTGEATRYTTQTRLPHYYYYYYYHYYYYYYYYYYYDYYDYYYHYYYHYY